MEFFANLSLPSISIPSRKTSSRRHLLDLLSVYCVSTIPWKEKKMVGNCENMILISSATNNQIDEKGLMASTGRVMEKPTQDHNQQQLQLQQQQALKCPRCDSSNTKFCYYNNYSLSQPRHFCKACKRYWTRGGTLRNVPVGGGCRKNKRLKKPAASADPPPPPLPSSATNPNANPSSNVRPHIDMSSTSTHHSPLFYGLPTNASHLNLPYPMLNSRVSGSGYDLQPQLNAPGLGFSSGLMAGTDQHVRNEDYRNGFNNNPNKQIQDVVTTSNPLLPSYSFLGSSPSPTMASLLASSFEQQKFMSAGGMKDVQTAANGLQGLAYHGSKNNQVKMEQTQNRFDWNVANSQNQSTHEQQISSSDPSSLYWNQMSGSTVAWLDPANMGSSVPSLI